MKDFAEASERIADTTKKLEKIAVVAAYFKSRSVEEAAVSAIFLSGRPFAVWEEAILQVGGRVLWRLVGERSGKTEQELSAAYRRLGDLGAVASEVLPSGPGLSLMEARDRFRQIAVTHGSAAKESLLRQMLSLATAAEAKYLIKIMTGDLRIGLKESLVEESVARAYGGTLGEVQRANMLLGDLGETVRLAASGRLAEASMRLFHPLGFMLASPAVSADDAMSYFQSARVEDKYDGVRAQVHSAGDEVRIFSRTRDDITASFPELPEQLSGLPADAILDGEILAWNFSEEPGRALPFSALQKRLGRKNVSDELLRRVPVVYLAFDVLYAGGELLIDRPLRERAPILDSLISGRKPSSSARHSQGRLDFVAETPVSRVLRAPMFPASSPGDLDQLFEAAQARGNEGLMIKDPESAYLPGRRGKSWLKLKRELATLDVVVTAVEYGHGKRIGVLSDYTFAVWDGQRLANIGKAYSGLTDVEIAEMSQWFLQHVIEDQGFRLVVEPKIVLEVAFNNMMISERHESGLALRFPRIVRLRPDKSAEDADTLKRAREILSGTGIKEEPD